MIHPRKQVDRGSSLLTSRIIGKQIRSVGIDLGKTTFHLLALGADGKVLVRRSKNDFVDAEAIA